LTGDNGRYAIAPVCHFKGVMDEAAAAKAYEQLSEEMKTDEHRKNWDNLYSHQYTVPNTFSFTLEVLPNCGYTNHTALAAACDIIVDSITASKMWKVKVEGEDGSHMEIVMDEYVGYLFENELQGKPGMQFVKYGKRHPHDQTGTLRIKTATADVDVIKIIQAAVEPLRRFYVGIATGVGGKRLHPQLQKALDAFKRSSEPEKRERLLELGVERSRAESAPETDLDTMAQVWLQQTERAASDIGSNKEKDKEKEKKDDVEVQKEEEILLKEDKPAEAAP
jgi:DNA-directed RNA polymerase subunit L